MPIKFRVVKHKRVISIDWFTKIRYYTEPFYGEYTITSLYMSKRGNRLKMSTFGDFFLKSRVFWSFRQTRLFGAKSKMLSPNGASCDRQRLPRLTLPLDFSQAAIVTFGVILFSLYLNGPTTIVFSKDRFKAQLIVTIKIDVQYLDLLVSDLEEVPLKMIQFYLFIIKAA